MPEFLVAMDIRFPEMPLERRRSLLEAEAAAVQPYIRDGSFRRVWRTWGTHTGNHGHLALWNVPDEIFLGEVYRLFPLVRAGYGVIVSVTTLLPNPNDPGPGGYAEPLPDRLPFPLTYGNLRGFLDAHGSPSRNGHGEGMTATVAGEGDTAISVHDHPQSGRPRELHFMIGDTKIAEFGPPDAAESGDVGPGYIGFLAEWAGRPVHHEAWKKRILADNGLLFDDHQSALAGPRHRVVLAADPS